MAVTSSGSPRRAARIARRLGLDANPLRRATDRAEAWLRIGVVLAFLIAGPIVAIAAGHAAEHAGLTESRAQLTNSYRTDAVLLYPAPTFSSLDWAAGDNMAWVMAKWTGRDGVPHTGQILAQMGSPTGTRVRIWVSSSGAIINPPLPTGRVTERAIAAAVLAPLTLGLLLLTGLCLAESMLGRRRMAAWDADWLKIESRWSSSDQ